MKTKIGAMEPRRRGRPTLIDRTRDEDGGFFGNRARRAKTCFAQGRIAEATAHLDAIEGYAASMQIGRRFN